MFYIYEHREVLITFCKYHHHEFERWKMAVRSQERTKGLLDLDLDLDPGLVEDLDWIPFPAYSAGWQGRGTQMLGIETWED